jgi:hypothetical protein
MKVEIGAEAAKFPEKEYINGIAFAVHSSLSPKRPPCNNNRTENCFPLRNMVPLYK